MTSKQTPLFVLSSIITYLSTCVLTSYFSDNGTEFKNQLMGNVLQQLEIDHIFISTAESIQLCYTSHFVVVVGSSSIGINVVNKSVLMIAVVACVVRKSPDALVEVVIFLDFDFMYVYLFSALECTV